MLLGFAAKAGKKEKDDGTKKERRAEEVLKVKETASDRMEDSSYGLIGTQMTLDFFTKRYILIK